MVEKALRLTDAQPPRLPLRREGDRASGGGRDEKARAHRWQQPTQKAPSERELASEGETEGACAISKCDIFSFYTHSPSGFASQTHLPPGGRLTVAALLVKNIIPHPRPRSCSAYASHCYAVRLRRTRIASASSAQDDAGVRAKPHRRPEYPSRLRTMFSKIPCLKFSEKE